MRKTFLYFCLSFCFLQTFSQYTFFKEKQGFAIEVSLSNSKLIRLPAYRSAISSLAIIGDQIIGGTTAEETLSPFVFTASFSKKEMTSRTDLADIIPGQRSIATGFFRGKNNTLYAGTIANKITDSTYGDGHLLEIKYNAGEQPVIIDLGTPVKGEGVFSLTIDTAAGMLYGLSFPSGVFFTYRLSAKVIKVYPHTATTPATKDTLHQFSIGPEKYLSRALAVDHNGRVYGSKPVNRMFVFNPVTEIFSILNDPLPDVWGRNVLGQADALITAKDGKIYGGNSGDGQLFEIRKEDSKIRNLGKPIMMNRIKGLVFGADNKLYGIAGAPPGYAHFFSYDPSSEGFADYGNPQFIMKAPGIEQGIEWRGFRLGSITTTEDKKYIILGEDESLSQLLIYPVVD